MYKAERLYYSACWAGQTWYKKPGKLSGLLLKK